MNHRHLISAAVSLAVFLPATSATPVDSNGGLSIQAIEKIKKSYEATPANKALHNAIAGTAIDDLALNADNKNNFDDHFSHRVPSKGITNQRSSGRCWLFTGLNVL